MGLHTGTDFILEQERVSAAAGSGTVNKREGELGAVAKHGKYDWTHESKEDGKPTSGVQIKEEACRRLAQEAGNDASGGS